MPIKIIFPCIIFFPFACSTLKPVQKNGELSGYIYLLKGNQMPSPGRPLSKGHGVSRDIYVYEPTPISLTLGASPIFTQIKTGLITHIKSDSTGHYALSLPAGKYSVFVREGIGFFAAENDGSGVLNPVEVIKNTSLKKDFIIAAGAVY